MYFYKHFGIKDYLNLAGFVEFRNLLFKYDEIIVTQYCTESPSEFELLTSCLEILFKIEPHFVDQTVCATRESADQPHANKIHLQKLSPQMS